MTMNVDRILEAVNRHRVAYILIGGMNFLLRHAPVLTFDVDLWIEDSPENLARCEKALAELEAEWGDSEETWGPVAAKPPGWLASQDVFCLTTPHGAVDIFRSVKGLSSWSVSRGSAHVGKTAGGVPFVGLSDDDMLACQMALPEAARDRQRIEILRKSLGKTQGG